MSALVVISKLISMRHALSFGTLICGILICPIASAVPVYLSPDSLYQTGQYNREWLEARTSDRVTQRWLRVKTSDDKTGWIAEDHILSKLLLSSHARTQASVLMHAETSSSSRTVARLPAGARVRLLGRSGRWFEAQPEGLKITGFLPSDQLRPDLETTQLALFKKRVPLREQASLRSDNLHVIEAGERAEVLRISEPWVFVRLRSKHGYVERSNVVLRDDLPTNAVLALRSGIPLRADSLPFSPSIRSTRELEPLRLLDSRIETWGRITVRDEGDLWWPMNQRAGDSDEPAKNAFRLRTSELFKRTLFDMAASPAKPEVKFASASGIFRTTDGIEWTRIDLFRDQNHPIAISEGGRVFIGPYVSDDHGVTFTEYIKWDNLVQSIRDRLEPSAHNIRILEIKPMDARGRRIELKLDIGLSKSIRVSSQDSGQNWQTR